LVDERLSRRSGFREGTKIRLADGQAWTIPAPPNASESQMTPFDPQYTDVMRAIEQAEDPSERQLAELSLAIFLLGHNYCLSAADYQQLLGFRPGSAELAEWQAAFRNLAEEHLQCLPDSSGRGEDHRPIRPRRGWLFRLVAWVRGHLPSRWWSIHSRLS
jgi:hypothetical protein